MLKPQSDGCCSSKWCQYWGKQEVTSHHKCPPMNTLPYIQFPVRGCQLTTKVGFFFVSQILVQSPGTVVDPGFPESKFRPVVLVRKSSFLHIVQLSLTVTVKSVWISLHKHQLSGTEEKKNPCRSLWKSFTKAESFVWAKTSPRGQGSKCTVPAKKRPARGRQQQSF